MIGAIIGDIAGSVHEWNNIKTRDFPLFSPGCFFTDDTVMTLATAEGLIHGGGADDFIAAITGSIAEAAYKVPDEIKGKALSILDGRLRDISNYSIVRFALSGSLLTKKIVANIRD